ncbi:MAG: hypothetical protein H0U89_02115 [Acidimicrobiia bacterium]|nr:hypothetical protein [Acidimicrobiia bacterium]
MPSKAPATVVAYQRLRLREIRGLYEELYPSLDHYLGVERRVSEEIDVLADEFGAVRETLISLGADVGEQGDLNAPVHPASPLPPEPPVTEAPSPIDFEDLAAEAGRYLTENGIDPHGDPLLQVLGSTEASEIRRRYKKSFGDIEWDESDYLIVLLAGFVATLLDVFLVRIPMDTTFLGRMQPGSPMTRWIRENSKTVHEEYLKRFEKAAKVPYDMSVGKGVDGLSPKVHRLMSAGHDPILGFIFGVMDLMGGTGTYIDKYGDLKRVATSMSPEGLVEAFLKVFLHLLSDVFTSAGIQPPFFTLLQLVKTKSPFVLGPSGEKVSWTNVARYMYVHGYDLRHFATMGIVPASVEIIVRGWWLLRGFVSDGEAAPEKAKLTSMLMLGHLIATSGNLLKTGVIFGMNPLALNWAEMLALPPVTVAWISESIKRDRKIRVRLDEEWTSMYQDQALSS